MPDNLARESENSGLKLYTMPQEEVSKPEHNINVNPHKKRILQIRNTIDALFDIRLSLSVKKIVSNMIKRSELEQIVNRTKEKIKDDIVKHEIDKVFDEYLTIKNDSLNETPKQIWENNSPMLKSSIEEKIVKEVSDRIINESQDNYQDKGQEKGVSLIKRDGHFKNSVDDLRNAS